jgi:hypothetical protein
LWLLKIYGTVPPEFKGLIINLRDRPDITVERIIVRLSLDEEEHRNASSGGVALYTLFLTVPSVPLSGANEM